MNIYRFLACSALAASLSIFAQSGSFSLTGSISGIPDGSKVALREVAHEPMPNIYETTTQDGNFSFQGELEAPLAVTLLIDGKMPFADTRFILEPTSQVISAVATSADDGNVLLQQFSVAGSPLTEKYRSLLAVRDPLDSLYANNQAKHKAVAEEYYAARSARDEARMKEIEQTDPYKAWQADDKAFFQKVNDDFTATILSCKDDFFGPLMMISLLNFFDESSRPMYEQMSDAAKQSRYGRRVVQELYPAGRIGEKMPSIALKDRNGDLKSLQEACAGKKLVLLDFWASWCRPCRAEIPNFKKIYHEYADKGFDIYSVSIDDDPEAWQKALDATGMTWTNVIDIDDKAATDYKVRAVPTIYLLDSEGRLVAENLRGPELAAKIATLLTSQE